MGRLICLMILSLPACLRAQLIPTTQDSQAHAYVVTFGPGEEVWEKFGHNVLWVHDPQGRIVDGRGTPGITDAAYSWGMFDFDAGYPFRFIAGKLTYWMDAYDAPTVVQEYIDADRSTYIQELNLSPAEIDSLIIALELNRLPENRRYKYDYYIDNCSTRVRDAIDDAVGGEIKRQLEVAATGTTYRWHTRRLVADDWLVDLSLHFMLGPYCDRGLSRWQESFLPMQFMKYAREVKLPDGRPLVKSEQTLHTSGRFFERSAPPGRFWPYLLFGVLIGGITLAASRAKNIWARRGGWTIALAWCLFAGGGSMVLLYTWFLTRHIPPKGDWNILPVNPLLLALVVLVPLSRREKFARAAKWVALAAVALGVIGILIQIAPFGRQQNWDIIALALAANGGIAAALVRDAASGVSDSPPVEKPRT
jgi:hypothetical protein